MLEFISLCILFCLVNYHNYKLMKSIIIENCGYYTRSDRYISAIMSCGGPISTFCIVIIKFLLFIMEEFKNKDDILEDYR